MNCFYRQISRYTIFDYEKSTSSKIFFWFIKMYNRVTSRPWPSWSNRDRGRGLNTLGVRRESVTDSHRLHSNRTGTPYVPRKPRTSETSGPVWKESWRDSRVPKVSWKGDRETGSVFESTRNANLPRRSERLREGCKRVSVNGTPYSTTEDGTRGKSH